jgi:purine-binding chemotaxis protein CheW
MSAVDNRETEVMEKESHGDEVRAERIAIIDFKMVTFSLAGKDYAIDIMQVKEIAKAGRFTYVPNTSPFVLGVYNLRGDIIPIIDLRIFFNIPTKARESDAIENMIIITVEEQTFGIVVDLIDKVVGISKSSIQPPHPIFGDINIKYIHGVVENQGRLYILLDVARIFGSRARAAEAEAVEAAAEAEIVRRLETKSEPEAGPALAKAQTRDELDISFIRDGLAALVKFHVTTVNDHWVAERYREWRDLRASGDIQLSSEEDARQYLERFYSPESGRFWSDAYMDAVSTLIPANQAKIINVWIVGCGKGYEAYSMAILLREKFPNSRIRVYANDSDLLAISNAPMLTVAEEYVTARYKPYLVQGVGGTWTFNQAIKDMILFEYHDCTNQNAVPNMDIIMARDVLSFMNPKQQSAVIADFTEKLKDTGVVILGRNEVMPQHAGWLRTVQGDVVAFSKE